MASYRIYYFTFILSVFLNINFAHSQVYLEILKKSKSKDFKEVVQQVEEYYKNKNKGKGSGYKQFKRWEYFHRSRLDSGAINNSTDKELKEFKKYQSFKKNYKEKSLALNQGNWISLGPNSTSNPPAMGRVSCITIDPADSNIIYVGTPSGGLWKSSNRGAAWACITDGFPGLLAVSGITIDPTSPLSNRRIYILTGDGDGNTVTGIGVLKSEDNGITWTQTPIFDPNNSQNGYKLLMHPTNPKIIFAATDIGLYKTIDGGASWKLSLNGSGGISDVEFKPGAPNIMYAASFRGIYRSSDNGVTWTIISTGLPNPFTFSRIALAVSPANPSYVYALFGTPDDNNNFLGLFRSTDSGLSYTLRSNQDIVSYQSMYGLVLEVSPSNAEEIYGGGVNLFKSVNGGLLWNYSMDGAIHVDNHALQFLNKTLFSGTDGGIHYLSSKDGNWKDLSTGLVITQLYKIGADPNGTKILNGTQDNGSNKLIAKVNNLWIDGDGMECFVHPNNSNILYGTYNYPLGFVKSLDDGNSYSDISNPTNQNWQWVTPFTMDPNNPDILYSGYEDIFRKTETIYNPQPWENISNGKIGNYDSSQVCSHICVAPSNSNYIYVVKWEGLYKTKDGGKTWASLFPNKVYDISYCVVDPTNPDIVFITKQTFSAGEKVFKSINGGATWQNISGTLPNVNVNCIEYQRGTKNGLYIGTDIGVFYRDDNLTDWVLFRQGLPYCIVNELEIHYATNKIRAATYGRGVWESDLYGPSNKPPIVSITSPTSGGTYSAPATIIINANASDSDGSITKVEFFQGTTKLGEDLTSPYSFTWSNVAAGSYSINAKATDNGGTQTTSTTVNITVSSTSTNCTSSGTIRREYWANVSGIEVSQIPVSTAPTSTSNLNIFEGPSNVADNYGARYSGYVCAPLTGAYTFWIACNDKGELWLSTDDNPANKVKIAYVVSFTGVREWDKLIYQKSASINLVAGKRYYIEALHKEGTNSDNLAVGWQLPNGTQERPIPGNRLSPYGGTSNIPPTVSITSPTNGQSFTAPANITINANSSDTDGSVAKVEFFQGTTKLGEDLTTPYSFAWNNVAAGSYSITAKATDNGGAQTTSSAISISVSSSSGGNPCAATGTITREVWNNITGSAVTNIPVNQTPTTTSTITSFRGPNNTADNYGARYRGYVCPPTTGNYTFWIESDKDSELYLSTNSNPANKVKIAYVIGFTGSMDFNKYPSQKSALIPLVAGQAYYIEALHKESTGTDHCAVRWQIPSGALEAPIPGSRLAPYSGTTNTPPAVSITSPTNGQSFNAPATVVINANASDANGSITKVEFFQGTTKLGEDLTSPYSNTWSSVAVGTYSITAKATDNGGAQTTSSAVSISVSSTSTNCTSSGTILREYWSGVSGIEVSQIPISVPPTSTSNLNIFEGPTNAADNYGARYRGYICAPITGAYIFWIACNDKGELWLSTDDNPSNKVKIAYVVSYTGVREWDKLIYQKSANINLVAGKRYYIEALHKEGVNSDNLAVGWQLPNGVQERPIPGNRLSPSVSTQEPDPITLSMDEGISKKKESSIKVNAYPNPINSGELSLTIEGYQDNNHKVNIEIMSLQGKTLYSDKVHCDITCPRTIIPIDHTFPKGVYLIKVRIDGQVFTEKLLID